MLSQRTAELRSTLGGEDGKAFELVREAAKSIEASALKAELAANQEPESRPETKEVLKTGLFGEAYEVDREPQSPSSQKVEKIFTKFSENANCSPAISIAQQCMEEEKKHEKVSIEKSSVPTAEPRHSNGPERPS